MGYITVLYTQSPEMTKVNHQKLQSWQPVT